MLKERATGLEENRQTVKLAEQIRAKRIERGLSQEELAKAIFVSRQTISNWETDRTYPDVESLLLLSQLFNVTTDELLSGDIELMKRIVHDDARKLRWLSWVATASAALGIVFFVGLSAAWTDPFGIGNLSKGTLAGAATFLPLWAVALGAAIAVEHLKKKHDLVTYQEILAFTQRKETSPEGRTGFARTHPAFTTAAKLLLGAGAGALLGVLVYKFTSG